MSNFRNIFPIKDILSIHIFVLVVQLASLFLTSNFLGLYQSLPSYQPAGNTVSGSILNSLILVFSTFVITVVILVLLKRKRLRIIKLFFVFVLGMGTFSVSYLLVSIAFGSFLSSSMVIVLSIFLSLIPMSAITILQSNLLQLTSSFILGSLYGTSIAIFLKPPTIFLIPIAFAIYDIYAVFRGPLKSLVDSSKNTFDLRPLIVNIGNFNLGVGDLVFYSMIPSSALLLLTPFAAFLSIVFIHIGMILTFYLLTRFDLLPGLPIPIALSFIPFLLFY
jgi:hypothetical protein